MATYLSLPNWNMFQSSLSFSSKMKMLCHTVLLPKSMQLLGLSLVISDIPGEFDPNLLK